jgi:hypothetical protein
MKRPTADARNMLADQYEAWQHGSKALAALHDDRARYLFCLARAEKAQHGWYEGKRDYIISVLRSDDKRYEAMGPHSRVVAGAMRWTASPEAQDFIDEELRWSRWAQTYLMSSMLAQLVVLNTAT